MKNSPQVQTQFSILHGMMADDPEQARIARERFANLYGGPLRDYLVQRCGTSSTNIDDIVQEFLLRKMFPDPDSDKENFVQSYFNRRKKVPTLRFRGYLLRSLWFFAIDQQRGKKLPVVDANEAWDLTDEKALDDTALFDEAWARNLLSKALEYVRDEPVPGEDGIHRWPLFQSRVLLPALTGDPAPSYELLRAKFRLPSPRRAATLVRSAMDSLRDALARLVRDYLPDSTPRKEEILAELNDLKKAVSGAGGLGLLREFVDSSQPWAYSDSDESIAMGNWSRLLDLGQTNTSELWDKQDFAGLWNHLLETAWIVPGDSTTSLGSRLYAEHPNLEILDQIRRLSKQAAMRPEGLTTEENDPGAIGELFTLPREFGAMLYLLSTAAALLRGSQLLSKDPEESFLPRIKSALSASWIDRTGRGLLLAWLRRLDKDRLDKDEPADEE